MASGRRPGKSKSTSTGHPAVVAATGLLHHRRGWTWTLVVSLAGLIGAVGARPATGGTAALILNLIALLMLVVFVVALVMVCVITVRLRRHPADVHGSARAAHRSARRPVLAHQHDLHRHPVGYAFWLLVLAGWMTAAVVLLPRLVDSVAYLAGAGGNATFMPSSYVQSCVRRPCSIATDGMLKADGHESSATWPAQVPLDVPFAVREPVWRWALGSGLINGDVTAVGSFVVGLIFEGGALLAVFIIARPYLGRFKRPEPRPARTKR